MSSTQGAVRRQDFTPAPVKPKPQVTYLPLHTARNPTDQRSSKSMPEGTAAEGVAESGHNPMLRKTLMTASL